MALRYEIDDTHGIVRTTASGTLTDQDLLDHKKALLADPRFEPGMKELSDIRNADRVDVTPEGIARAVVFDTANTKQLDLHRLGLLVPSDFVFGLARMYQQRTDGNTGEVAVFRTEDEALAWLESEE